MSRSSAALPRGQSFAPAGASSRTGAAVSEAVPWPVAERVAWDQAEVEPAPERSDLIESLRAATAGTVAQPARGEHP